MWNIIDLAYLAGFVDGEGCFFIGLFGTKPNKYGKIYANYHTLLKISNTDLDIMKWIQITFGATFEERKKETRKSKIERPTYNIYITGDLLTNLTQSILPFLKIKKKHAENMLRMRSTYKSNYGRGSAKVTDEEKLIRQDCHKVSRVLNSRFHNHPLKQDQTLAPYCPSADHAARSSKSIRKGL
jgi:hypothetical protein